MECVASILRTTSELNLSSITALTSVMPTHKLPIFYRTDDTSDINGLVRFAERGNLVSACAPPISIAVYILLNQV